MVDTHGPDPVNAANVPLLSALSSCCDRNVEASAAIAFHASAETPSPPCGSGTTILRACIQASHCARAEPAAGAAELIVCSVAPSSGWACASVNDISEVTGP